MALTNLMKTTRLNEDIDRAVREYKTRKAQKGMTRAIFYW